MTAGQEMNRVFGALRQNQRDFPHRWGRERRTEANARIKGVQWLYDRACEPDPFKDGLCDPESVFDRVRKRCEHLEEDFLGR